MMLKELITCLEKLEPDLILPMGFNSPHSYRGDYAELGFEPAKNISISDMLVAAKQALGTTYEGYKGGEYKMEDYTDIYLAIEGHTGEAIGPILLNCLIRQGFKK